MEPFTIRLKDRTAQESKLQPLRLKLDPGSKTTGMAVMEDNGSGRVIFLGEIKHKPGIKQSLESRRSLRRSRRNRKTRYRKPRFEIAVGRRVGCLPSLEARVNQTMNATAKLQRLLPITAMSTEHVKFDTQLMATQKSMAPSTSRVSCRAYEVREYLSGKVGPQVRLLWCRECASGSGTYHPQG